MFIHFLCFFSGSFLVWSFCHSLTSSLLIFLILVYYYSLDDCLLSLLFVWAVVFFINHKPFIMIWKFDLKYPSHPYFPVLPGLILHCPCDVPIPQNKQDQNKNKNQAQFVYSQRNMVKFPVGSLLKKSEPP